MGKGSNWRKGTNHAAYRGNDEYWDRAKSKKDTECWSCKDSWQCSNAYKDKVCLGLVIESKNK